MLTRFINEQVEKGLIELKKVASKRNIANFLTKIICGKEFVDSFNKIMGHILATFNFEFFVHKFIRSISSIKPHEYGIKTTMAFIKRVKISNQAS